ncbi:MAG: glycosyltransferase family 2 protein [Solirubrobacterales bacterium]
MIPVHGRAGLTRQCLDTLQREPPAVECDLIVVDDASQDETPQLLESYGERVRTVRLEANAGFAAACNAGAEAADAGLLVFLNNDTIPVAGWLDTLVAYADEHPGAGIVGAKLVFPNETIQHAGVVICQDGNPRHIYAGFPAEHPAVNVSRRFQAVTAACMLVRREAFDASGGFDEAYRNCLEDTDLCLRAGGAGHEVHYCHESVLYHLESVSRGRRSKEIERNAKLFRKRWDGRARRDDIDYYVADGLMKVRYRDVYPVGIELAPELAFVSGRTREAVDRLLEQQSREVVDLLKETVRLTALAAELGPPTAQTTSAPPAPGADIGGDVSATAEDSHRHLLDRVREGVLQIHDLQSRVAAPNGTSGGGNGGRRPAFAAADYFRYRHLMTEIRDVVEAIVPAGATVAVVSRGDDELLELGAHPAWHFPRGEDGAYVGYHPHDSAEAITHLEALRKQGARYLLVPPTAYWWLDHYRNFALHLEQRYRRLTREDEGCVLFELSLNRPAPSEPKAGPAA